MLDFKLFVKLLMIAFKYVCDNACTNSFQSFGSTCVVPIARMENSTHAVAGYRGPEARHDREFLNLGSVQDSRMIQGKAGIEELRVIVLDHSPSVV